MSRSSIAIVGAIVILCMGALISTVVVLIKAGTEAALLTAAVSTVIVPTVTALFGILQGMVNNSRISATNAKLDAAAVTLAQTHSHTQATQDSIIEAQKQIGDVQKTVQDVLTKAIIPGK